MPESDHIPPRVRFAFQRVAAEWVLHEVRADQIAKLADEAIDAGVCSPNIMRLWELGEPSRQELESPLMAVLADFGVAIPDKRSAATWLCRAIMQDIVSGVLRPRDGARQVVHLDARLGIESGDDLLGLNCGSLLGLYYEYDETDVDPRGYYRTSEERAREEARIDRELRAAAAEWLQRFVTP